MTPPSSQKLANTVFPVIPIRYEFSVNNNNAVDTGQPAFREINLSLDPETFEVFDIYAWESVITGNGFNTLLTAGTGGEQEAIAALLEQVPTPLVSANPPTLVDAQETALNLLVAASYMGDVTVIATHEIKASNVLGQIGTANNVAVWEYDANGSRHKRVDMVQPWTVGANLAAYGVYDQVNGQENQPYGDYTFRGTVWGRIRNAKKDEWYAINYRRFR